MSRAASWRALVEAGGGLVAGRGEHPVGLRLGLGDGGVGGALGQQQRAADRLGLVDARMHHRLAAGASASAGLLRQLLEAGDGGPGARLHRRRLVLGGLQGGGDLVDERVDLVLVVAPPGPT